MKTPRALAARAVVALAAAALATGLAACSSDDPDPNGTDSPGTPASTAAADDPYASWIAAIGDARSYAFTMEREGDSTKLTGALDRRGADDRRLTLEMARGGETFSIIIVGQKAYRNLGTLTENKYIEADTPEAAGGDDAERFAELMTRLDLTTQLTAHQDAVLSVEKKGDPITLDGVSSQPYEVTLDASKLSDDPIPGADSTATSSEPATVIYTYYVGPDDLPRRVVFEDGGSTLTTDYTDWGQQVSIEAPPASRTTDVDPFADDAATP